MTLTQLLKASTALGLLIMLPVMAHAGDDLATRASVGVKAGSERSALTTEIWAPLAQKSDRVLYGDARLMGDDDDNREGNLGIGYRQIVPQTDSVIGGHVWIDRRRTDNNSTFHQLTFGAESLGKVIDLRANGYVPLNGTNTITTPNIGQSNPYLAGTGFYYDTTGFIKETPQYGVDAEIGYRVPAFEKQIDSLHVYGGGYSFFRNNTDSVTGFRIRTEAQVNKTVTVGARFQHDAERGDQGFLEATIRFPFSAKKLYQTDELRSRLDESPERDIDIVTGKKSDNGLMKPFINASTGQAQHIIYVNNASILNGDGSIERPFNTLLSAQSNLKANDIVYVFHGDGTTTGQDQGILINQPGVSLIGSGSALTLDAYTFLNAGTAPTITNVNATTGDGIVGNGVTVLADNGIVSGFTVSNATGYGIRFAASGGKSYQSAEAINNTILNSSNYAIAMQTNGNGEIQNATIAGNTVTNSNGIFTDLEKNKNILIDSNILSGNNAGITTGATGSVNTIIISNNSINGSNISYGMGNGHVNILSVTNNTVSNSSGGSAGFSMFMPGGIIDQVNIDNLTSNNNSGSGIVLSVGGTINNINVSNSILTGNTGSGFSVSATGLIGEITASNTTATGNTYDGIWYLTSGTSTINHIITDNVNASNNGNNGFDLFTLDSSKINSAELSNSDMINNLGQGVIVQRYGTSTVNLDMGGGMLNGIGQNRVFGNGQSDLFILAGSSYNQYAQNNWWGNINGLQPSRSAFYDGSSVNASNYLTTDPRP